MRSNYKKIGSYVQKASKYNKEMMVTNLRGININKLFMPSVANTIGIDLSKYKIVSKYQFGFNPMHVGRDEMLPISMLDADEPVIVSPAYVVFEIKDHEELDPEYLMMWCRRPEFDRNAWFTTDSSVRGGFCWSDFCDMELPMPSIEKQREIVREYNTIVNSITLNEQLNQKLEETAQAIYKQWFVDFEFPITSEYAASIGKPELEGNPYKSSGGEMFFCEELENDTPKGWMLHPIKNMCEITSSKRIFQHEYIESGVPFYRGKEIIMKKKGTYVKAPLYISEKRYQDIIEKFGKPEPNDILISAVGTLGVSYLVKKERFYFKDGNLIWLKEFNNIDENIYLYSYMQSDEFSQEIKEITIGSTQSAITITTLGETKILLADPKVLAIYSRVYKKIIDRISRNNLATSLMQQLKDVLFTKMSKTELVELVA